MRLPGIALLTIFLASGAFGASLTITSTTSVTAQTVNNTSTSNSFTGTSNGNPAPRSISKISLRELLYPGAHYQDLRSRPAMVGQRQPH